MDYLKNKKAADKFYSSFKAVMIELTELLQECDEAYREGNMDLLSELVAKTLNAYEGAKPFFESYFYITQSVNLLIEARERLKAIYDTGIEEEPNE